jgi:YaeC family lipoprotein
VEIVDFTDYAQPNPALAEGEIDLNQFQRLVYVADYNVSNNQNLTPIEATAIYPLGLYSRKYESTDAIPAGETVAVPSDASNQTRSLLVLQSAGLIKLESGGNIVSDLADVDEAASKVKVTALDAELTATSLDDLAAAIINNDFVERAGLSFDDSIAEDDPSDEKAPPYVNVFASREQDKDNAARSWCRRRTRDRHPARPGARRGVHGRATALGGTRLDVVVAYTGGSEARDTLPALGFEVRPVTAATLAQTLTAEVDMLLVAGTLNVAALTQENRAALNAYLARGGGVVGLGTAGAAFSNDTSVLP